MFSEKIKDDLIYDSLNYLVSSNSILKTKILSSTKKSVEIGILFESLDKYSEQIKLLYKKHNLEYTQLKDYQCQLEVKSISSKENKGDVLNLDKIASQKTFFFDKTICSFWVFGNNFFVLTTLRRNLYVFPFPSENGSFKVFLKTPNEENVSQIFRPRTTSINALQIFPLSKKNVSQLIQLSQGMPSESNSYQEKVS